MVKRDLTKKYINNKKLSKIILTCRRCWRASGTECSGERLRLKVVVHGNIVAIHGIFIIVVVCTAVHLAAIINVSS